MIAAAVAGILFAIGLVVSDMTSPGRIVAFLDLRDPTLMFVMAGAIGVYAPISYIVRRRSRPFLSPTFHWPSQTKVDARLVGGAAIFGAGWGLSGYCPGPALVATGTGRLDTLVFVATLIAGIALTRFATKTRE